MSSTDASDPRLGAVSSQPSKTLTQAPVDEVVRPGHVGCSAARKEHDQVRDLLWCGEAAGSRVLDGFVRNVLRVGTLRRRDGGGDAIGTQPQFRRNWPRTDGIHPYSVPSDLFGQRFREVGEGRLCGPVVDDKRVWQC